MPRYGYSTRQSGPPSRDHITEYRPAICRGNAMGNTNLWRFLCPAAGTQNCMKTGGKSPYFSPVGGANEAAHILSLMGGRAAIQGRNPAETNAFQNRGKEVSNMAVFRIEKTRDYTVMSNHHLRDRSLSLKAKGLLSLMLSLPEGWDYTTKGLARICKDGVDSICAGVRERESYRWHGGGSMQIQCRRSPQCSRRRTPEASHPSCLDCRYSRWPLSALT